MRDQIIKSPIFSIQFNDIHDDFSKIENWYAKFGSLAVTVRFPAVKHERCICCAFGTVDPLQFPATFH